MPPITRDAGRHSRRSLSPISSTVPSLVYANDPDICPVGTNCPTPAVALSYRGEAKTDPPLGNAPLEACTTHGSTYAIPYDVLEAIMTHLIRDPDDLQACSSTCRSWYTAAVPHLHHTLTLRRTRLDVVRGQLRPLHELHQLGLIHQQNRPESLWRCELLCHQRVCLW